MKGKIFLDSNVILYLFSTGEPEKKDRCRSLLLESKKKNTLVWSTQVIQEFYFVLTRKFMHDPSKARAAILFFQELELVVNNFQTINKAIDIQIINKLSFWDSLIVSAADQSKCQMILTEDLSHGQKINGILIQNPFEITV